MHEYRKKSRLEWFSFAGNLFFLLPNLLFLIRGFNSRYWADDYCFSGILREHGFFGGLGFFYSSVSNRFSAFIFSAISEAFGSRAIQIVSFFTLLLIFCMTFLLLKRLCLTNDIEIPNSLLLFFSQIMLFFSLRLSPNIEQSVYWRSGLSHYYFPLFVILLIFYLITFSQLQARKALLCTLLFIIAFSGAGFSESYAALQTGALLSTLAALFILGAREKKAKTLLMSAALAGSLLGMAVMVISPGNQLRLNTLQQAADALTIARLSVRFGGQFLLDSIKGLWLPHAISFLIGLLSGAVFLSESSFSITTSKKTILIFLIPAIIYCLVVCICAPTAFGMMAYPENRVLMLARYVMTSGIILYGFFLGFVLKDFFIKKPKLKEIFMFGLLILSLYPLRSVSVLWEDFQVSKERALLWDQRNGAILGQIADGEDHIAVRAFDSFDQIAEMGSDPSFWVNQCAAQFYGVESITAVESEHE